MSNQKCPNCGSPEPQLRGGDCANAFHDPKPRSKSSSGSLTAYLLACGWDRDDAPADIVGECGASGNVSGWCEKPARWSRRNPTKRPMCAQHAEQAQRYIEAFPDLSFPEPTS